MHALNIPTILDPSKSFKNYFVGNRLFLQELGGPNNIEEDVKGLISKIEIHLTYHDEFDLFFDVEKIEAHHLKGLFRLFSYLNKKQRNGKQVSVTWMYAHLDHVSRELGEDLASLFNLKCQYQVKHSCKNIKFSA